MYVRFEDASTGESLLSFEGRVVELFRAISSESLRLHLALLTIEVTEPNRKGIRDIWFSNRPNRKGGGFCLRISEPDWPALQQAVAAINEAKAALPQPA